MEIILKEDVKGLGYKNDIVNVKPGYGRNYLIPQGLAIVASTTNKKIIAENQRQAAHKAEKIKGEAVELQQTIQSAVLEVPAKVSETGKIFGAVTTIQLADALKKQNINVDRRKITIDQSEVKLVGDYTATIDLHREVKAKLNFKVIPA
jgi:large subunit ribosomal protein L9